MKMLTLHEVRKIARRERSGNPDIPTVALRSSTSLIVLGYFLGSAWVDKHFVSDKASFFKLEETPGTRKFAGLRRIWELADMLLNLQHIEGFGEPLKKLRDDDVETGFAAFEAAKILRRSGTHFKFVVPNGTPQWDYDLLAFTNKNMQVAIEAKCKLLSTKMKQRKIMNTLGGAVNQLPQGQPGVIMLRVPPQWAEESDLQGPLARAARNLLSRSDFLAGVLVFSNRFIDGPNSSEASMIILRDFWSEKNEFSDAPEWRLCRSKIFDEAGWISVARLLGEPWPFPSLPQQGM